MSEESKNKMPFIFAIAKDDGEQRVFINTKAHWKQWKCLTDSYSKSEAELLEPLLIAARLCNVSESTYEAGPINVKLTDEELHRKLIDCGLDFDPEFQNWMAKEVAGTND